MLNCNCCNSEIIDLGCISKCDEVKIDCTSIISGVTYNIKYLDAGVCKDFKATSTSTAVLIIPNFFKENRQIDFQIFNPIGEPICGCFTFKNVLCIK